jgi:hypothetical protein
MFNLLKDGFGLMSYRLNIGAYRLITTLTFGIISLSAAGFATESLAQSQMETREVAADQAFPLLKGFLSLPLQERDEINLVYILKIKNGTAKDASIVLKHNGQHTKLSILGDGRISPLPSLAQMRGGAMVRVSGPKSMSVAMKLRVTPRLAPSKTMAVPPLVEAVAQTNRVAKKVGGLLAIGLPKQDRLYFTGASSGTVTLMDGSTKSLPEFNGIPFFVPSDYSSAATLNFETQPQRIEIEDRRK